MARRSRIGPFAAKRTLEVMPMEIQVDILRHLLQLCALDSDSEQSWGFGSLGIPRTSGHFSNVSLGILYGENSLKVHRKVHIVRAEFEPRARSASPSVCIPPVKQAVADFQCPVIGKRPRKLALENPEGYAARYAIC